MAAADIELATMLAKCRACDSVFSFSDRLGAAKPPAPAPLASRPPIRMPKGFEVFREGKTLAIERSWFSWQVLPLGMFTVFWNGFMVMWFSIAIASGAWPMALFGSIHGLVGLGLLYAVLLSIFEVSTVEVEDGRLKIAHGPLPYPGGQDLDVREIDQLYTKRKLSHGKNTTRETFELHAVMADRRHQRLLEGLETSEQALYLEQELEDFLGITDHPVLGELDRPAALSGAPGPGEAPRAIPSLSPRHSSSGVAADAPGAGSEELALSGVELHAGACAVCGDPIQEEPHRCHLCDTPHHPDCWSYQGGCAAFGCSGKA